MSNPRLTATQWEYLRVLRRHGFPNNPGDRTLRSLARRGLAIYRRSGAKYEANRWELTDAGRAVADKSKT